ncbi:unnamed protein product [Calypogeia fissa]
MLQTRVLWFRVQTPDPCLLGGVGFGGVDCLLACSVEQSRNRLVSYAGDAGGSVVLLPVLHPLLLWRYRSMEVSSWTPSIPPLQTGVGFLIPTHLVAELSVAEDTSLNAGREATSSI